MRAHTRGSGPGDDSALMDVAAMTRGNQLATAVHIIADNVRAAPPTCQESSILLADKAGTTFTLYWDMIYC